MDDRHLKRQVSWVSLHQTTDAVPSEAAVTIIMVTAWHGMMPA
jgi:hypothetical protein